MVCYLDFGADTCLLLFCKKITCLTIYFDKKRIAATEVYFFVYTKNIDLDLTKQLVHLIKDVGPKGRICKELVFLNKENSIFLNDRMGFEDAVLLNIYEMTNEFCYERINDFTKPKPKYKIYK